ncbi:ATP-binding protein [Inhella sp.]|uniref:ATP-binding protein n=1 Tax=Inhella sp. TaxID=1921806 RepID=UPI0035B26007
MNSNEPVSTAVGSAVGDLLDGGVVWTPEIEALSKNIVQQLRLDQPGMIVTGQQRVGKSWACRYVVHAMEDLLGYPIAAFLWEIPDDHGKSVREFIQLVASQSGCERYSHRDKVVLRNRLLSRLIEQARSAGTRRIVLMIDEAQNLIDQEYAQLVHIFNSLERQGLRPFVLLMGQPELMNKQEDWMTKQAHQMIGRFSTRVHTFNAIAASDFEAVLDGFDSGTPEESAAYRTHPKLYAEGFRVRQLAPRIVEAVSAMAYAQNLNWEPRMPMQYLRSCLLALLNTIRETGVRPEALDQSTVTGCLKACNFGNVLQFYAGK